MTSSDERIAGILGEAPSARDPNFRVQVFMRIAERARRKAAIRRVFRTVAIFALIGAAFPAMGTIGIEAADLQPMLFAACTVGVSYAGALLVINGPARALTRLRAVVLS